MIEIHGTATMIDGCRIAWRMDGPENAPVLVLSNSLGTAMAMWTSQVPALSEHFRLLRYDTRGHGKSSVLPGEIGLDRLGRDVLELLDTLGIARAHFCGLSLGGMTGQWLGVFAPERIDRLVLANTSSFMGPPESWQTRINLVRDLGMVAIVEAVLERWFTPGFAARGEDAIEETRQLLLATDPQGYSGCCAAIRDMDLRPVARLIAAPSLIIAGSEDPATPPDHAKRLAFAVAGSKLVSLRAAHLSNIEQSDAFTAALINFIS
jgi:3-oxoadipate enol-lactonase